MCDSRWGTNTRGRATVAGDSWNKVGSHRKAVDGIEYELDTIITPFGFEIEPYPLTEMLGEISSDIGAISQAMSVTSIRPVQTSPPTGEELAKPVDSSQITDTSDYGDKESSVPEAHAELSNRTAAPSQASTMMPSSYDMGKTLDGEAAEVLIAPPVPNLPPPVAPVRTAGGKALLENLYLPPLPSGVKPLNGFGSLHSSLHVMIATEDLKAGSERLKSKANVALNPNLLKAVNQNMPSSAVSDGKKKKEALADVVEKADGKRKKEKKEEKDDKFCKPGDYVIIVEDVTSPPFLNVTLEPAFLHVKVTQKKRARSKMETRRN